MKPALIALIVIPVVAAVSAAAWFALRAAPEPSDWRVSGVQDAVRARLADPASATFGPIAFGTVSGGLGACGAVNGLPFKAQNFSGQTFDVLLLAASEVEASAIRQMCADDGMQIEG